MALAVLPRILQPRFGRLVMVTTSLGAIPFGPRSTGLRRPGLRPGAQYICAGILELFHRPAVISAGSSTPLFHKILGHSHAAGMCRCKPFAEAGRLSLPP